MSVGGEVLAFCQEYGVDSRFEKRWIQMKQVFTQTETKCIPMTVRHAK